MRFRSLCLLLVVTVFLFPATVFAEGETIGPDEEVTVSPPSPSPLETPLLPPLNEPLALPNKINTSAQGKLVNTRAVYTYARLMSDIKKLARRYPSLVKVYTLGLSTAGRSIPLLVVGNPQARNAVWVDASIHAREYMTTQIVMNQLEFLLGNARNGVFEGKRLIDVLQTTALHVAPMLNPDGVELCQRGLSSAPKELREQLLLLNGGKNFRLWKANINGVDLNRNFSAGYEALPLTVPAYAGYKGTAPFSEAESNLAKNYLQSRPFRMSVSYHCIGGEIYWFFGQDPVAFARDLTIVSGISQLTGYSLVLPARSAVGGGLKDFVVTTLKIPAITVELRSPKPAPIPQRYFKRIWNENAFVLWHVLNLFSENENP